jgi:glycine cleavage system aminomethyltransferase T
VIIRVLHRGHGRVAKKLVGLRVDGPTVSRGAKVLAADREIGSITSAAQSPEFGTIALAYLHRDFLEPGTAVDVQSDNGRVSASVAPRHIRSVRL